MPAGLAAAFDVIGGYVADVVLPASAEAGVHDDHGMPACIALHGPDQAVSSRGERCRRRPG